MRIFYDQFPDHDGKAVSVMSSSLAFEGPHCRIDVGDTTNAHLNLDGARRVIDALTAFISEAESGEAVEDLLQLTASVARAFDVQSNIVEQNLLVEEAKRLAKKYAN